ncbi:MAG: TIGR02466 family protein [Pseudomonadota bacterium]
MAATRLFPTLLYQAEMGARVDLDALEAACWMIEEGDAAGHEWCEREGYPGYTSYASLDDLPQRAPAFEQLADCLAAHARAFAQELHWDMVGKTLAPAGLWVNVLGEGMGHSGHIHPGSVLSGTAFVAMPPGAGALRLEDPRLGLMMAAPPSSEDAPEEARRFIHRRPAPGDVLMWESWLRHEVVPTAGEGARISISFNFALEGA